MPTGVHGDSNYRRPQRFFKQFKFNSDQLARVIYDLFTDTNSSYYLNVDRTSWKWGKRDINILMLAISHGNIAIPLMWTLLNTAGNSSTLVRQRLLRRYLKQFDGTRVHGLLADREFFGQVGFAF